MTPVIDQGKVFEDKHLSINFEKKEGKDNKDFNRKKNKKKRHQIKDLETKTKISQCLNQLLDQTS